MSVVFQQTLISSFVVTYMILDLLIQYYDICLYVSQRQLKALAYHPAGWQCDDLCETGCCCCYLSQTPGSVLSLRRTCSNLGWTLL